MSRAEVALGAFALAIAGVVTLAVAFAGPATYDEIMRRNAFYAAPFRAPGWPDPAFAGSVELVAYTPETLVALHRATVAYVLGERSAPPSSPTRGDLFSPDERAHLADVRALFTALRIASLGALVVLAALVLRAERRGRLPRYLRDVALAAGIAVTAIAAIAAIAFEPFFLLFHYVFFPQGNFLFDLATSNLLALYPGAYWYEVTLRIGVTFLAADALLALAAAFARRGRVSGSYTPRA